MDAGPFCTETELIFVAAATLPGDDEAEEEAVAAAAAFSFFCFILKRVPEYASPGANLSEATESEKINR